MNILVSVNNKYMPHLRAMFRSVRDNMPNEKLDVYLLNKSLTPDEVKKVSEDMQKECDISIHSIKIEKTPFDDFKLKNHFTIETMMRLMATEVLPKDMERILWLDADIIVVGDLTEFYNSDFDGNFVCACPENINKYLNHKNRLELSDLHIYFNAGVLLMNLEKMRLADVCKKYVQILNDYSGRLKYNDQDILNIAFEGQVKYFDSDIYNCRIASNFYLPDNEYKALIEKCCILHFAAKSKPWQIMYCCHPEKFYWKYALEDRRKKDYIKFLMTARLKTYLLRYRMHKTWNFDYQKLK